MRKQIFFLLLNILLVIFLISVPFISYHGTGFLGEILCPDCKPLTLETFLFGMSLMLAIFVLVASIGVFGLYKLGKGFISDNRRRRFYFLSYLTVFFLLPGFFLYLTSSVDSKIIKQRRTSQQIYTDSINVVNISERSVQGLSCLDKSLILDMDVEVKYVGDYYLSGYLELDENLPAEIGRLETRIANGINTWPFCNDDQRDEQGRCRSLLHLESGLNRIEVEFPGFDRRLVEIEGIGSFPLRNFWIEAVIHRKRGLLERLLDAIWGLVTTNVGRGAVVAQGKINVETYNASSEIKPEYKTNYYNYQEIREECR